MKSNFDWNIDFNKWSALANSDPRNFEKQRSELLNQVIQCAPLVRQHRLRCLQWRIDTVRDRSPTPLAACIRLSGMMWDSLTSECGLLEALRGSLQDRADIGAAHRPKAAMVLFYLQTQPKV